MRDATVAPASRAPDPAPCTTTGCCWAAAGPGCPTGLQGAHAVDKVPRDAAERRATATMLPPEREGYELGAGLMSEAEIVFFSAHADMKSYYATGEQKRGAGSGPMSLVIGFALSAVLFVSVSWVAVKQGWIGSEEEGYGVLGA